MATQNFQNTTGQAMFVGGKLLQPGEGREFNAGDLPSEHQAPAPAPAVGAEPTPRERMLDVLKKPVTSVIEAMSVLTAQELAELRELESQGAARVSLLKAIDAEILALASAKLDESAAPKA